MKILLLSDLNSVHTQRWAFSLAEKGIQLRVVGLNPLDKDTGYYHHKNIETESLRPLKSNRLGYFLSIPKLKKIINEFRPDLVHAHFATSYGLLASVTKKTPIFLTMWGDDVLIFPKKSFIHKKLIQFNLCKADHLSATSFILKDTTLLYSNKNVSIIPFGVDTGLFKAYQHPPTAKLVIGTIKALETIYGIDYLIKAYKVFKENFDGPSELLIVGGGSKENELKELVKSLDLTREVTFAGKVEHLKIPEYHSKIDIFVALSRSESFGVAVVEAQATGVPAIVSNVGGLPEVVEDKVTGLVIPDGNIQAAAEAMLKLANDKDLRLAMGEAGKIRVNKLFQWNSNVNSMVEEYQKFLGKP